MVYQCGSFEPTLDPSYISLDNTFKPYCARSSGPGSHSRSRRRKLTFTVHGIQCGWGKMGGFYFDAAGFDRRP
jgi:hypothetical protein